MQFTLRATSSESPPADGNTSESESPPQPTHSNILLFEGSGSDGVGTFTLVGGMNLRTGLVEAVKNYAAIRTRWEWAGMITPFGIVGKWGDSVGWGGWWWIWPREWSE